MAIEENIANPLRSNRPDRIARFLNRFLANDNAAVGIMTKHCSSIKAAVIFNANLKRCCKHIYKENVMIAFSINQDLGMEKSKKLKKNVLYWTRLPVTRKMCDVFIYNCQNMF
jgi:hypothetical protein